jgi:predicted site-specific integrase-resolvase
MTNLLPEEAAQRLRVSKGTLANWRVQGNGPRFIKWGRKVLYPEAELASFEQKSIRSSTAEKVCGSDF